MQLVAYGAQDIYLTGNPQITFFKVVYRRHTNFSMEAIEQTLSGTIGYGSSTTATISRNGDLVHKMYVEHTHTGTAGTRLCANYGSALLKEVELEIGGQRIDKHYGHWMEVWAQLTEPNPTGLNSVHGTSRIAGTLLQNLGCMGGVGVNGTDVTSTERMFIPLQFWFCRNPGLALPLIALQYHEVKVKITTEALTNLANAVSDVAMGDFKLWADYIYLDTDERRRFAQVSHEYLIEQLQVQEESTGKRQPELNFNHPVKELIWASKWSGSIGGAEEGPSTPRLLTRAVTAYLQLNGHDRMAEREMTYYTRAQVHQHHTGFGGVNNRDSIAVYSFALKPEEHQPSGTCNFSRIDNAKLVFSGTVDANSGYYVYAVNYNVLRIMSGMGGLAYSN